LTFEEIKGGLSGLNEKTAKEVQTVLDSIDTDQSGNSLSHVLYRIIFIIESPNSGYI